MIDVSGTVELFQAGSGLVAPGLVAATAYQATRTKAGQALKDIVLDAASERRIWQELKNVTAKLIGLKGNGEQRVLESASRVAKTAGNNGGAAVAATAVAAKSAAMLAVLMNLVNIAATLALNIATVKVLDNRIDAEARGTQLNPDIII